MNFVRSAVVRAVSQGLPARALAGTGFCTVGAPLEVATVLVEGVSELGVGVSATWAGEQAVRARAVRVRRAAIGGWGRGTRVGSFRGRAGAH
jgi:hypothetical protein